MKILVIDDHVLIRQAMQGVLKKLKRDVEVLEASSCQEALQMASQNPDISLILLDLTMPDRDGFSVLTELRELYPAISVVVLSAVQDSANVTRALDLGAAGYIPKSARADIITNALRLVMSGGIYVPPEILARGEPLSAAPGAHENVRSQLTPEDIGLTDRQLSVLALVMQGKSNKTICRDLRLAEPTVKNHVTAILRALKVCSRTEAVVAVNRMGWNLPAHVKS
jgi:DNA-binding NarL/FixJ family response regulator